MSSSPDRPGGHAGAAPVPHPPAATDLHPAVDPSAATGPPPVGDPLAAPDPGKPVGPAAGDPVHRTITRDKSRAHTRNERIGVAEEQNERIGVAEEQNGTAPAPGAGSVRRYVGVPVAIGTVLAAALSFVLPWEVAALLGWDTAMLIHLSWLWRRIWPMDAERTAMEAVRNDPSRMTADILLLSAAVASLLAVGLVIVRAANSSGAVKALLVALVMASVLLSWATVHTTFTLRYARLYYTGPDGGVDFNDPRPPSYPDFAYLAFTIGMTFQVSDTALQTRLFRATALRQALLSYLFGAVILAATINLVAGLSK